MKYGIGLFDDRDNGWAGGSYFDSEEAAILAAKAESQKLNHIYTVYSLDENGDGDELAICYDGKAWLPE